MTREASLVEQIRAALEEPPSSLRIGLRKEHVKALLGVLAVALVVSFIFFGLSKPRSEAIAVPTVSQSAAPEIVVDVAGKVRIPGVYRLPQGSRAIDAIEKAGGVLPGTATENINLAHVLSDGEQILVGGEASGSAKINLNTASVAELDQLPGVGPVMAQRIVSWRQNHRFHSIEQLQDIPGVGAATFANLKDLVRI